MKILEIKALRLLDSLELTEGYMENDERLHENCIFINQ